MNSSRYQARHRQQRLGRMTESFHHRRYLLGKTAHFRSGIRTCNWYSDPDDTCSPLIEKLEQGPESNCQEHSPVPNPGILKLQNEVPFD